jgi:hypothetical protein
MREPTAPRPGAARCTLRRVRRPVVLCAGEQLGDEHGQYDLARELRAVPRERLPTAGVGPASRLDAQGPGKERAEVVPHLCQGFHTPPIRLRRRVRSMTDAPPPDPLTVVLARVPARGRRRARR